MQRGNALRPVEWIRDCDGPGNVVGETTVGVVIVEASEFDDFTKPTVVRCRGELVLFIGDITFGILADVAYGITIVNPLEVSPPPFDQRRGNRWLWWGCTHLVNQGVSVDLEDGVSLVRLPFDIRSMRKRMVDGSNLQLCIQNINASSATVTFHVGASTLVKE